MERSEKGRMAELMKNREAISQLAQSSDAQKLMALLKQQSGGVQQAAQAAAAGNPRQLMAMMEQLMNSKEGAELVDRIGAQAKQAGLE
ncbi:hypothetical protein AALA54_03700 [Oscillospiraceae bacterium 44-34]